ncbi:membrane dipeptidase [candidate division KSB3 bacterium]|uniref:Membrane dipeptidase n=1 Tax=candidate division KSB3 bacterium TaxID=2044937 RepID=A0A9D5Q5K8_9BACT|nr:membrane dipeptidase [candidate division KSB3 bacterium]MBD3324735.1 membrane dipeptidase [candidate division KSB3 bacterium]
MDDALRDHVNALHQQALTVNAHFDLTYDIANKRDRRRRKVLETDYLEGLRQGDFNLIVSALFVHNYFLPEMALRKTLDQISYLLQEMEESPGIMRRCTTPDDILQAKQEGQIGILLSFEGIEPLQNDIHLLRVFYELGVRGVGLTWSRRNYAGDGAFFTTAREGRKGGLTPFGVAVIEAAEALGMFLDVSHLNDEGFWDVMKIAQQPVIASHSNCRALVNSMRNLTDRQIEALAEKGGVIGMNALSAFTGDVSANAPRLTAEALLNHVDHIVKLVGVEHVGLGFDFCDTFEDYLTSGGNIETYDVLEGHGSLHEFTAGLIRRGYADEDILRILGGNFMRVFEATLCAR